MINVLVTGANGFMGRNLKANLLAQKPGLVNVMCFDLDTSDQKLSEYCGLADFVFHLAGVNRPQNKEEFYEGNTELTEKVLNALERQENLCPILMSSSSQALLDNDYGKSKQQAENALFAYGEKQRTPVYVYRLPGVFGKWCRPNYNSVVATFCYNIAHSKQVDVNGRETSLKLVYIDDVIKEFFAAMDGRPNLNNSGFCEVSPTYDTTLGELIDMIRAFKDSRETLSVPNALNSFEKKLYSTYLSYLPEDGFSYTLKTRFLSLSRPTAPAPVSRRPRYTVWRCAAGCAAAGYTRRRWRYPPGAPSPSYTLCPPRR